MTIHPDIQKAVDSARTRIAAGADIETVLADECHPALMVPEFAFLVGIDCPSYQQGLEWERDQERVMEDAARREAEERAGHADTYMGAYPSVWSEEDESARF